MRTVTAAIIRNNEKVLLTRRAIGQKLAGYWEFPGGKLDDGESLQECLQRELFEELSIESKVGNIFCESLYEYEHGSINLIALETIIENNKFVLTVHDKAEWVEVDNLLTYKLAPADIPIAKKLKSTLI